MKMIDLQDLVSEAKEKAISERWVGQAINLVARAIDQLAFMFYGEHEFRTMAKAAISS